MLRHIEDLLPRPLVATAIALLIALPGGVQTASAGSSWYSKARKVSEAPPVAPGALIAAAAAGDVSTTVFDIVISLYNDPTGDDDPDNDTGSEEQTNYENITRFFADAICEESNEALKLGSVRIFRNGIQGSLADIVWNASEWPRASVSGFGVPGRRIMFGDIFPDGLGTSDLNYLSASRIEDAGYTLGHEFGHYILGVYDEYVGSDADEDRIFFPQTGDTGVVPSIMNSQWNATDSSGNLDDPDWLNHSTEDNYEANTAQGRVYGKSAWEVLVQPVSDDPRDGDRSTLPKRVRYTALEANEPTSGDGWIKTALPGAQTSCRNQLEIIWMEDAVEMQIVLDRSGSMSGTPISNAQSAAQTLVDEVAEGNTALGVVSFNDSPSQDQVIIDIVSQATKDTVNGVIAGLSAGGDTAMFDAADLALDNLLTFSTNAGSNAAQLVFLLSDGLDNSSSETQSSISTAYQNADVPIISFAYGSFAPDGVLRELADDTGGLFRASPTDLNEVSSAFLAAKAAFTSSAALIQDAATAPAGGSAIFDFNIDSTIEEVSVFANYLGAPGDIGFALSSPGGPASLSLSCGAVETATTCSGTISAATVVSGGSGGWSITASNGTGSAIAVNVDLVATPLAMRTFDLVVAPVGGSVVEFPSPILLTATIDQGLPISGVDLFAQVTSPSGAVSVFSMFDTGTDGDGIAEDGTYSAILQYGENGVHDIAVTVDNGGLGGFFTLDGLQPAHPSPNVLGLTPTPPPLPPDPEAFTRTATAQLTVTGFQADDHPNMPPGTAITPDNTDVPGQINFAGDPDVFTVDPGALQTIVFRVTDLALGMETRLRIFEDDGSTEIVSVELADLVPGAAYVAVEVSVGSNAQLHAEVTHAASGTGIYQVSAGPRIVSDPPLVAIDIKPDSDVNPINPGSGGKIPVVILGNGGVDLNEVDRRSLAFGPGGAPVSHPKGVFDDFNDDPWLDYQDHYRTQLAEIAYGDSEACLSGEIGGVPFTACDTIRTVPGCGIGFELVFLLPPVMWAGRRRRRAIH